MTEGTLLDRPVLPPQARGKLAEVVAAGGAGVAEAAAGALVARRLAQAGLAARERDAFRMQEELEVGG